MLRDLQKESPNMNYQVSKVKIAIAKTWDAKYADWENKPVEKYKDDWITSNITRFICLIRVCAKGLAEKADKRKDWVSEIFGEGVVGESQEEGVEPLGNPCGISAAVGCEGCGFILTIFNDPDHCGYCNVCLCKELEKRDSEVDNPTFGVAPSAAETDVRPTTPLAPRTESEFIYGYSQEKRQAFKTRLVKGKGMDTIYTKVFKGDDEEFVQAKFPGCEAIAITDLTLAEFKDIQELDPLKNTIFHGSVDGKYLKLIRLGNHMAYLQRQFHYVLWNTSCCIMLHHVASCVAFPTIHICSNK